MSDPEVVLSTPPSNQLTRPEPGLMELVQQIINSPNAKDQVEVVKAMLDMKERLEDRAATQAFAEALAELQARIPPITRDGKIIVKGVVRSRYATIDQIDDALRPLMAEFGFAFSMSETGISESGMREFAGTLTHKAGHEKSLTIRIPLDKSEFRTPVQSEGSTISYAKRQLLKAFFNITERAQDDDGSGLNVEAISEDQLKDLETKLSDTKANVAQFCKYFNIEKVQDLKKADLATAHEMLDRRAAARKAKS